MVTIYYENCIEVYSAFLFFLGNFPKGFYTNSLVFFTPLREFLPGNHLYLKKPENWFEVGRIKKTKTLSFEANLFIEAFRYLRGCFELFF